MNASANLLIVASAGSGKTHQLTSRLLRLLEAGAPGRRILASTFTRKAAGEIRDRLVQRVARAAAGDAKALADLRAGHGLGKPAFSQADARRLLRTVATGLGRQSVATLDSVLAGWTQACGPELGLENIRSIVDEKNPLARRLHAKALLAALHAIEAQVGQQGMGKLVLLDLLERLHKGEGKRSITGTLGRALDGDLLALLVEQPDRGAWTMGEAPGRLLDDEAKEAWIAAARAAATDLPKTRAGAVHGSILKSWNGLVGKFADPDPDALLEVSMIRQARESPEAVTANNLAIEGEPLRLLAQAADHAVAAAFRREERRLHATWLFLSAFDRCHKEAKREAGVLCFSDLPRLLAEGPVKEGQAFLGDLAWRLDGTVEHLLLDEFQDTSRSQWRVLRLLADERLAGTPERSLMVVGDPKQAIYAWRGGCSELMDRLRHDLSAQDPGSVETLARSFRSSPVVLDAVNKVFVNLSALPCLQGEAALEAARKFQDLFTPHSAAKSDLRGRVRLVETPTPTTAGDDEKPDPRAAHAQAVADHLAALAQENPKARIGVLVRARRMGEALLPLLQARGLPVRDEGGVCIAGHPAVAQVLALLRLAELPDDRAARAVVAHGPLAAAFADDPVGKVRHGLRRHGLAGFVLRLIHDELAPACDPPALRRLHQLADLLAQLESGDPQAAQSGASLAAFVADQRVAEPGAGEVVVMTVHGSKGLEFDLVVLPDLDAPLDQGDARAQAVALRDDPTGPPVRVLRRLKKELQDLTPAVARTHRAQEAVDRYEDLCLLYVAMTRAKQGLDLLVMPRKERTDGETKASFAQILREALGAGYAAGPPALEVAAAPADAAAPAKPVAIAWQRSAAAPRFLAPASPSGHGGEASAADLLAGGAGNAGTAFGSAVHAVCERIGFVDEETWDAPRLREACGACGVPEAQAEAVAAAVLRVLQGGAARFLRRDGATDLRREWPFLLKREDELVSGVFDRVQWWRDGAGKVVRARVLDFKTDRLEGATAQGRAAHHAPQMQAYRRALARLTGCAEADIACVLLFTATGEAVEM